MNRFKVSKECRDLGLRAGAIVFRDVEIRESSALLREEIAAEIEGVRHRFENPAAVRATDEIQRHYEILRAVGVKPRSHPPSTQKLLEFALRRGELPVINDLVDAYNLISIRSLCSLGAHDLARVASPIELRLFDGDEFFLPLGGGEDQPVTAGEFGYVDAQNRVVCRLDSLQAEFSKVTAAASEVLLIIESTDAVSTDRLLGVFDDARAIVHRCCGGSSEVVAPI